MNLSTGKLFLISGPVWEILVASEDVIVQMTSHFLRGHLKVISR